MQETTVYIHLHFILICKSFTALLNMKYQDDAIFVCSPKQEINQPVQSKRDIADEFCKGRVERVFKLLYNAFSINLFWCYLYVLYKIHHI